MNDTCRICLCILVMAGNLLKGEEGLKSPSGSESVGISAPKEPLLATMPAQAAWVITYRGHETSKQESEAQAGRHLASSFQPKNIVVTKGNGLKRTKVAWDNGRSTEGWSREGMYLAEDLNSPHLVRAIESAADDFPLVNWVSVSNYKGLQKIGEEDCFLFEIKEATSELTPGYLSPNELVGFLKENSGALDIVKKAYVSVATRRPVAAQIGKRYVTYTYLPPGQETLALPEKFVTGFEKWLQQKTLSNRRPPATWADPVKK